MRTLALVSIFALFSCTSTSTLESAADASAPAAEAASPDVKAEAPPVVDAAPAVVDAAPPDADVEAPIADAVVDAPWQCQVLTRPPPCPTPAPTYATVAPLFQKHCVACHKPGGESLEDMSAYDGIVYQRSNVMLDLENCTMPNAPPWPTDAERQLVLEWLACDAPD